MDFQEAFLRSNDISFSDDVRLREKQFLLSCERGDIGSVRKLLAIKDGLNINCVDPLGRNALLIAIENENIEMIELLLDHNIETGDAILYAIGEENVEAVEIIIEHLEKIDKFNPEDNYECIKLFLDKKGTVPHPHDVHCSCHECEVIREEDSLRLSRSRINAYRALASPSLICLSAKDPILYAFELSWELRRLSYIENEFRSEYQELSQKCQKFSVNMLDQVRGSKELEIVLNHTTTAWEEVTTRGTPTTEQLARLKLAIKLRQKRFVAHPNCQQLLSGLWYEGLPGFRNMNICLQAVGLAFPILSISYLLAPKSAIAQFTRKPFVKFLSHSASYIVFLALLIMASQRIDDRVDNMFREENAPSRKEGRGPSPTPVEMAITIWVLGLIWVEIKQLWDCGLHDYCHNLWNILDFITNSLYLSTLALRTVAYYQVNQEMKDPRTQHIGRFLQRKDWDAWDPTLVSECVFATANIFSSLKLVHIFTVNPYLGPLKISLGEKVKIHL
ncbi:transient-receptor-potential calcium channel protein, partial [Ostertagia ostertagi]